MNVLGATVTVFLLVPAATTWHRQQEPNLLRHVCQAELLVVHEQLQPEADRHRPLHSNIQSHTHPGTLGPLHRSALWNQISSGTRPGLRRPLCHDVDILPSEERGPDTTLAELLKIDLQCLRTAGPAGCAAVHQWPSGTLPPGRLAATRQPPACQPPRSLPAPSLPGPTASQSDSLTVSIRLPAPSLSASLAQTPPLGHHPTFRQLLEVLPVAPAANLRPSVRDDVHLRALPAPTSVVHRPPPAPAPRFCC